MTIGPKQKKKLLAESASLTTSITPDRLAELLKMVSLDNVQGLSPDMTKALDENGIHYTVSLSSDDPLEVYDKLRDAPKSSSTVEDNWKHITYRHLVLNGLNLVTMHLKMYMESTAAVANALCAPYLLVNPQNGITRLTALIISKSGYHLTDDFATFLSEKSALERYQDATAIWDLSKAEGAEYKDSIENAKRIRFGCSETDTGPSNPRWPL